MSTPPTTGALRLGVLDQSPVAEGSSGSRTLRSTIDPARLTEGLGYGRYWVAEHHGGPLLAGASPEALVGPIAAVSAICAETTEEAELLATSVHPRREIDGSRLRLSPSSSRARGSPRPAAAPPAPAAPG